MCHILEEILSNRVINTISQVIDMLFRQCDQVFLGEITTSGFINYYIRAFDNHTNLFKVLNLTSFNRMSYYLYRVFYRVVLKAHSFQCRSSPPPGGVFSNEEARLLSRSRGNDHAREHARNICVNLYSV